MKVYDSMAKEIISLNLSKDEVVKVFVCGPTVQDNFHVGHARTYIFFDSLVKYLRVRGYSVFYLQNITDIDDKIINRANEEGVDYIEVSEKFTSEYMQLMNLLHIDSVNFYARATLHIPEIINQISELVQKGYAYETSDGVYFRVSKFNDFGRLSGQNMDALKSGSRVDLNEQKSDPRDFVIWKKYKPGEPFWESPWGKGRPGWHIEDTAITEKYFGPTYHIHGSGTDLIFPHHEAEIAIERSISGSPKLADYWIHSAMININDEKMSKSLKNYVKIREVLVDYWPEELRYALLNAQFKTSINFSPEILQEARQNVNQISILYRKLSLKGRNYKNNLGENAKIKVLENILDKNIDFRQLFTEVLSMVGEWNRNLDTMNDPEVTEALQTIYWVDSFTNIVRRGSGVSSVKGAVEILLSLRKEMRSRKEFGIADGIRADLKDLGIYIEDKGEETIWWTSEEKGSDKN
ncbi:MAG: cysteine--tRNA ligase [Candidatus Thermoplasmatota archaeon]|nr:cysteine--tRNA ligase [Candidatus Thermoplasmatota archaeon]